MENIKFSDALATLNQSKTAIIGLAGGLKFQLAAIEFYLETGKDKEAAQLAVRQIKENYNEIKPYFNL